MNQYVTSDEIFMLHGFVEGKSVTLLYDDETDQGMLSVSIPENDLEFDDEHGTAKELSALLQSHIGYGPCVDLLLAAQIPTNHPLWDLNHCGSRSRLLN